MNCGKYKGVQILDIAGKKAKAEKKLKDKNKERGVKEKAEASEAK